jgi:hypothetical protein
VRGSPRSPRHAPSSERLLRPRRDRRFRSYDSSASPLGRERACPPDRGAARGSRRGPAFRAPARCGRRFRAGARRAARRGRTSHAGARRRGCFSARTRLRRPRRAHSRHASRSPPCSRERTCRGIDEPRAGARPDRAVGPPARAPSSITGRRTTRGSAVSRLLPLGERSTSPASPRPSRTLVRLSPLGAGSRGRACRRDRGSARGSASDPAFGHPTRRRLRLRVHPPHARLAAGARQIRCSRRAAPVTSQIGPRRRSGRSARGPLCERSDFPHGDFGGP